MKTYITKALLSFTLLIPAAFFIFLNVSDQGQAQNNAQHQNTAKVESAAESNISYDMSKLPEPVQKMRIMIIKAARSGDLDNMRHAMETNEIPPVVAAGAKEDPIEYWKKISADGTGRDILAILSEIMEGGYMVLKPGTNEESYVWPYHAEHSLKDLTPRQQVELYRLLPFKDAETMKKDGKYKFYRASIGKDGTWHSFVMMK